MRILFLLFVSILPVILIGNYIYNKDVDKEPMSLLVRLFFSGIGSFVLTCVFYSLFDIFFPFLSFNELNFSMFDLFIHVFFGIALIEEFSKWFFVYKISYNSLEFDQVYDMIVYCVFVALGFACIENIFYVLDNGLSVGIIRGLLAVPGHACDGVFMGYYLAISKYVSHDKEIKNHYLFMSLFVPILLHAFYDFCLISGNVFLVIIFLIFIIILYYYSFRKIKVMSNISTKIK